MLIPPRRFFEFFGASLMLLWVFTPTALSYQRFPLEGYTQPSGVLQLDFAEEVPEAEPVFVIPTETTRERLKRVLSQRYNSGRILRHVPDPTPAEEIVWVPRPQKVSNRPQNLGYEAPYQNQVDDFVIPPSLVAEILKRENQSEGTFVSRFFRTPDHDFYSRTFRKKGLWELVGVGTSNFAQSSRGRIQNIKAAIKKFDNLIIPKGETFSFNETLQSVQKKDGFVYERVIWNGEDRYHLGGGVCQISTTVYRAAFNAGLPIDERRNHSRKVKYYYPHGFDATIYLGSGPDLKFTNDTPGDLMLQFHIEGNNLLVLLYGTKDREVDTTQHGGWKTAYWWKRRIIREGETSEEVWKSYYRPEEEVVTTTAEE